MRTEIRDILNTLDATIIGIETLSNPASITKDTIERLQKARRIIYELEEYELFESRFEVADAVWSYYAGTKGVGHSKLLWQGLTEFCKPDNSNDFRSKAVVVVGSNDHRIAFDPIECVTFEELKQGKLNGRKVPLAWDNYAIIRMVSSFSIVKSTFRKIRHILED